MRYVLLLLKLLAFSLAFLIIYLQGWDRGFNIGYGAAMSDVILNLETPENYFKRFLNVKRN
jgi:hypothetical protein